MGETNYFTLALGPTVGIQGMLCGSESGGDLCSRGGGVATLYLLGPSPLTSGHLKVASQKEAVGTLWHLLSAQRYPCQA